MRPIIMMHVFLLQMEIDQSTGILHICQRLRHKTLSLYIFMIHVFQNSCRKSHKKLVNLCVAGQRKDPLLRPFLSPFKSRRMVPIYRRYFPKVLWILACTNQKWRNRGQVSGHQMGPPRQTSKERFVVHTQWEIRSVRMRLRLS